MGVLTADMKRVVEQQRLGFVATVCSDGTPNLSPKGTTAVWDDDHLVFANIRSPGTLTNLRRNPHVEVNVVDPFVRKGYRFKGVASILESGPLYETLLAFYKERSQVSGLIREVVMIQVQTALPIDSPAYDVGLTETQVRDRMERYYQSLRTRPSEPVSVFFYGLFMDESLLASKGVSPSKATVGYVNGYRLRIGRRATLVPDDGNRAYGVLMSLRADHLTALYSADSVLDYVSEPVSVVLPDGTVESAVCYNLPERKLEGANSEYANSLLVLAGRLGFPDDYLEQIKEQVA